MDVILERSMNNHVMRVANQPMIKDLKELSGKQVTLKDKDQGLLLHGEHNVIGTEEKYICKVNQQEWNPILKKMQDAAD